MMTIGDFFYSIIRTPVRWYFELKMNVREGINEAKSHRGPLLLIGPHVALEDSLIAVIYRGSLVRFLASDANWDFGFRNAAFRLFNVIPFRRQRLDVTAIRCLKQSITEGHSVGLFPEGARTWDGKTLRVIPSISKLIKLLCVPVYNITYNGLYLTRPRWAGKNTRRGRVDINIRRILTQDEVTSITHDELLSRVESALYANEFDWQRNSMVPFKGKNLAEHIELLLYRCPSCDAVNSLRSEGDSFACKKCGASFFINTYGFIEGSDRFDNTADWNGWQHSRLDEILNSDFMFVQTDIRLERTIGDDHIADQVKMSLSREGITIDFENGDWLNIPPTAIRSCDAVFSDCVEFYVADDKYRFLFDPKKNHMSLKLFEDIIIAGYTKPEPRLKHEKL